MTCYSSTGREWYVYRNTGTYGTPVWSEVTISKDITVSLTKDEIESLRSGATYKEYLKGFKDLTVEFPVKYVKSNTHIAAFQADFFADDCDAHDLLILDGAVGTSGSEGVRAIVALFSFPLNLPITDEATIDLSFKPTYFEDGGSPVESAWFTVP